MVQAAACRAALYGFNSHPQLFHPIHIVSSWLAEDFSTIIVLACNIGEAIFNQLACFFGV
jgi:hypothetical protein